MKEDEYEEVARRDDVFEHEGTCQRCGKMHTPVHLHHVIFRSAGGDNSKKNVLALCVDCHKLAHGIDAKKIRKELKKVLKMLNTSGNPLTY